MFCCFCLHTRSRSIQMLRKTELIFVRHAQSFNNCIYSEVRRQHGLDVSEEFLMQEERKLYQADSDLSQLGYQQAAALGEFLAGDYFHKSVLKEVNMDDVLLFSSPMKRCILTAREVGKGLNVSVVVHPKLHESGGCYFHSPEGEIVPMRGMTSNEIEESFPGFKCMDGMEDGWYQSSSIESSGEFNNRVEKLVEWIWSIHESGLVDGQDLRRSKCVVMVGHGNLISALMSRLMKGKGLFTHQNTACSHLQLFTMGPKRVTALKATNILSPTLEESMRTGAHVVDDHWIQEHMDLHEANM